MAVKELPDPELLRKLLDYDPSTGLLVWRHRPAEMFNRHSVFCCWNARHAGNPAFNCFSRGGYQTGTLLGVHYYAHRIAWAIHYGEDPNSELDHINGDKTDNRIANLRKVTRRQNSRNRPLRADNKTGVPGVHWEKACQKWRARIKANGKNVSLGVYDTVEEAVAVRIAAEKQHGYHPNHGRHSAACNGASSS